MKLAWLAAALCGAVQIATSGVALADAQCHTQAWKVYPSSPNTTIEWTVVAGKACATHVQGRGSLNNFSVSVHPKHGFAAINNSIADHGFGYKANANYTGPDEFQIRGEFHPPWQTEPLESKITVHVQVVDRL